MKKTTKKTKKVAMVQATLWPSNNEVYVESASIQHVMAVIWALCPLDQHWVYFKTNDGSYTPYQPGITWDAETTVEFCREVMATRFKSILVTGSFRGG